MAISDADFADLKIGHAVTVQGGCLKKAELLETRRTRCGNTFVKLEKTAPWLSRVVTGKAPCGRPLSRTNIIEFMRAQLHKSEIVDEAPADDPGDPMAAMDYDDMEHASAVAEPALATPRKHRKRTRRLRVEAEQIVSMAFPADILDGFADIHGDGGRRVTLLACAKHIWLHVDDVAWVIQVIRHQYSTGVIPPVPKDDVGTTSEQRGVDQYSTGVIPPVRKDDVGTTSEQRGVWWCFRDSAWMCRAKSAGRCYHKTLCVNKRAMHGHSEYEATRQDAYVAICEWQRRVEAGDDPGTGVTIVQSDHRTDENSEPAADAEASQCLTPPR